MKKKKYIAPEIVVIEAVVEHHLLVNSGEEGKPLVLEPGDFEFTQEATGGEGEGEACAKPFHQYDAWADLPSY